jgi:hypothetical protein
VTRSRPLPKLKLTSSQDQGAALALVSVRPSAAIEKSDSKPAEKPEDVDLRRAKDLIKLHYSMKVPHADGSVDSGLLEARRSVRELRIT